jgi:hypothetical protein
MPAGYRHKHSRPVGFIATALSFWCVVSFSVTACRPHLEPAPTILVEEEIDPHPPVVGLTTVTVHLKDAGGNPLTNARLTVEGDMSHPGMSPVLAESKEVASGRYQARIDFAMAGDWVLLLHIKLPSGQMVERQIDVKGVRAK